MKALLLSALSILGTWLNFTPPPASAAPLPPQTYQYQLLDGWNLVHFPIQPTNFTTAQQLIIDVARSGGYVTTVARWQDQAWQEYAQRGDQTFGTNFPIQPGQAYFLRNHQPVTWPVSGPPVDQPQLTLETGWNTLGFTNPQSLTASKVVDGTTSTDLTYWLSGTWEAFVKRVYAPDNTQEYGIDFDISPTTGYMIKVIQNE